MTYDIQTLQGGRRALVMGMTWRALLGEKLDKLARSEARRSKATHYCRGGRSNVVGLLTVKKADRRRQVRLYSAAAAFARSHTRSSGVVAARVALDEDRVWIAAALNGSVLPDSDRIGSVQEAADLLAELHARHPGMTVYGDGGDFELNEHSLQSNLREEAVLIPARMDIVSVPWPIRALALVALAYIAWDYGSDWWQQQQRLKARAALDTVEVDAAGLWRNTLNAWSQGVELHGTAGLWSVFRHLEDMPLNPGRWQLSRVRCLPQSCEGSYQRLRLGTRDSLTEAIPPHWSVSWEGFDNAVVHVPLELASQPLRVQDLLPLNVVDQGFSVSLQRAASLFESARLNPPQTVLTATPTVTTLTGAQAVPRPSGMQLPMSRTFTLTGPLRSLLALDLPPHVAIDEITFRTSDGEPRLARSRIAATLHGTYYAYSP